MAQFILVWHQNGLILGSYATPMAWKWSNHGMKPNTKEEPVGLTEQEQSGVKMCYQYLLGKAKRIDLNNLQTFLLLLHQQITDSSVWRFITLMKVLRIHSYINITFLENPPGYTTESQKLKPCGEIVITLRAGESGGGNIKLKVFFGRPTVEAQAFDNTVQYKTSLEPNGAAVSQSGHHMYVT